MKEENNLSIDILKHLEDISGKVNEVMSRQLPARFIRNLISDTI